MELEPSRRRASLRASDADREQIVFALRQHHGDGRLTVSEFTERMGLAYEAKTLGDLEVLTRDLPPLPPPLPEAPGLDPVAFLPAPAQLRVRERVHDRAVAGRQHRGGTDPVLLARLDAAWLGTGARLARHPRVRAAGDPRASA